MPNLLHTIIYAAATSLVVATVLWVVERRVGKLGAWFRPGALAGSLAVGAGFLVALRLALGGWPELPAKSADGWLLWIACGATVVAPLLQIRFFHSIVGPAALGMLAGGAMTEWALRNVLGNTVSPEGRRVWVAGIAVVMMLACAAAALATSPTVGVEGGARRSLLTRLRDDHWGTVAMGLMLGFAAPAVIFCSSIKLGEAMLGLAMAWAGVAVVGLFAGLALTGAGALAVVCYCCVWLVTYFLNGPPAIVLVLAALAPVALLVGYLPALRRRPWVRFVGVCAAAGGLSAAAAGVMAPGYLRDNAEVIEAAMVAAPLAR